MGEHIRIFAKFGSFGVNFLSGSLKDLLRVTKWRFCNSVILIIVLFKIILVTLSSPTAHSYIIVHIPILIIMIILVTLNSPTPHSLEQTDSKTSECTLEKGWNCTGLIMILIIIIDHYKEEHHHHLHSHHHQRHSQISTCLC